MVNKRGYLRILEALLAIILIFGFFLYLNQRDPDVDVGVPPVVGESQRIILDLIAGDEEYIECVVGYEIGGEKSQGSCNSNEYVIVDPAFDCAIEIEDLIELNIPSGYNYECEICGQSLSCLGDNNIIPLDKSVFTSTTFLAGSGDNEKVVRLYYWLCDPDDPDPQDVCDFSAPPGGDTSDI